MKKANPGARLSTLGQEGKPSWGILREDFMMGAQMKDWDKETDNENDNEEDGCNSDSDSDT